MFLFLLLLTPRFAFSLNNNCVSAWTRISRLPFVSALNYVSLECIRDSTVIKCSRPCNSGGGHRGRRIQRRSQKCWICGLVSYGPHNKRQERVARRRAAFMLQCIASPFVVWLWNIVFFGICVYKTGGLKKQNSIKKLTNRRCEYEYRSAYHLPQSATLQNLYYGEKTGLRIDKSTVLTWWKLLNRDKFSRDLSEFAKFVCTCMVSRQRRPPDYSTKNDWREELPQVVMYRYSLNIVTFPSVILYYRNPARFCFNNDEPCNAL